MHAPIRCYAWLLFLTLVICLDASDAYPSKDLRNIAHGKSYTLMPAPNYGGCTDENDLLQLTDGAFTKGHFWTQTTTVGWANAFSVSVTIDLNAMQSISGVAYSSAAGKADVNWPLAILLFISDDDATYRYYGDLVELDEKQKYQPSRGYDHHKYRTENLNALGRYIKFITLPNGRYTFIDEIEIFKSDRAVVRKTFQGHRVSDLDKAIDDFVVASGVRRRIRSDIKAIKNSLTGSTTTRALKDRLDGLDQQAASITQLKKEDISTIHPINDIHREVFAIQASIWRTKGLAPITVWQNNRWDMMAPTEWPAGPYPTIDVKMMRNEYRSASFNITNASDKQANFCINIENLTEGLESQSIEVKAGVYTDTKQGISVMAALPRIALTDSGYCFEIASGLTRQIWLTINSKALGAGKYHGKISINPGGFEVPLSLKVYPLDFPDRPSLQLGGWDYTNKLAVLDCTPENREDLIAYLKQYYVDTPWATGDVMPQGMFDAKGNMIRPPSVDRFYRWFQSWPNARSYSVFLNVKARFGEFDMGTPSFNRALANWIDFWAHKIGDWGIAARQLNLLLVDEPHNEVQSDRIIQYARIIRLAQPNVVIWENPIWQKPWEAPPELFENIDELSLNLQMWVAQGKKYKRFYDKLKASGATISLYSAKSNGRLLDPYAYHRLQHWFCWTLGAKSSAFWSFSDSGGASPWNEYTTKTGAYTPFFLDKFKVVSGKHMEAIREGMEDYEYIRMLNDRVTTLWRSGSTHKALAGALAILNQSVSETTNRIKTTDHFLWTDNKDRNRADEIRVEILDKLLELEE